MSANNEVKVNDAARSRKERPSNSIHFGDTDFTTEEDVGDATWSEVCTACCVHDGGEWGMILVGLFLVLFFLYFFLFGLELLGTGAKVMGGCRAGALFGDETNPIAGLMIGIIATVLLQSSSTTTSIIVSLTGSAISVQQGIYMVMGANIGTSVTNTIVAIAQMGDGDQLERAFAGATVHDMFNFLTVGVLLPVEVVTGYLNALTRLMVKGITTQDGESWEGPLGKIIDPFSELVIKDNSSLIRSIALGEATCDDGGGVYPIVCENGVRDAESCSRGLIRCNSDTNKCPLFFQDGASAHDDKVSGGVVFFIAIIILFVCLAGLVTVLQKLLSGMSTRLIYKATNINGYLAILVGAGLTMLVQSSSITTSTLTPFVGIGAIRLEQMLPLTLGANIGTTMTGLLAALVSDGTGPLRVALAHLMFNITGIIIWYPVPVMRAIPLGLARQLGKFTRIWKGFPVVYIFVVFLIVPLIFLGISYMFEEGGVGLKVLGIFVTIFVGVGIIYTTYWCKYRGGQASCLAGFERRQMRREVMEDLPDDMKYVKRKLALLMAHTGLPEEEDEEPAAGEAKGLLEGHSTDDDAEDDKGELDEEVAA